MNSHLPRRGSLTVLLVTAFLAAGFAPVAAVEAWQTKVDDAVETAAASGDTDFLVYMEAKADLTDAKLLGSKTAKGAFVYEKLTSTAASSQAPVLALLATLGRPAQSFWIANTIVTNGNLAVVQAVAELTDVKAIYGIDAEHALDEPVTRSAPQTANVANSTASAGPSIDHVNANGAWTLGYKGQGVVVAGADTGVRWTHEAIKKQYRGWNASTSTATHEYNWHNAAGPNAGCPADETQPCDDHDHGTHTVGTMVGDGGPGTIPNSGNPAQGKGIGMAPDAEWIACRNMAQGVGTVQMYMDCMEWFLAPTDLAGANPDPSKAPDVVNNSWGCVEACAPPVLKDMAEASRAAGIVYVVSAGNDNQFFVGTTMACNTINFPLAVYESVFTVGATEETADTIAYYSSLGPVTDNVTDGILYKKPDIVAPGSDIWSAASGADDEYVELGGTSMAGPHVAGLVALILSANPRLKGDVDTVERIIRQTAVPLTTDKGCGGDTTSEVPNNVFGWGRIDALAAVEMALVTDPTVPDGEPGDEPLDPAHNTPIPCELINTAGNVPRSAKNIAHVANVCEFVGTDIEFQSRVDDNGDVRDYAFVGTMGGGTRIFDVTDPSLPRMVGTYSDPGWQNDVQVFGDTLIMAFDPLGLPVHLSDCLKEKDPTSTSGGVDIVNLQYDPVAATLALPLTFQTQRLGCYLNEQGGGAHTITIHPSGEWLSINTSTDGIEVIDLRGGAFTFVRKIPAAVVASAHDVFFSADGNTLYSAGIEATRIVDVTDIFNTAPTMIANVPNNPSAGQGGDGHVVEISHQSDTTADGRIMVVTDEKGGGLSNTACNESPDGHIGGAHFWALAPVAGAPGSTGASPSTPHKIGTWVYPNPLLAADTLDGALADLGRTERACTIHVYRLGSNAGQAPAFAGEGTDGNDAVSRLPVNEMVAAHYGAGVWHVNVASAPGALDDDSTTWGKTLGWNVMPGADTWSAKEYKGYIYTGDMTRGFDVFRFTECEGVECIDAIAPRPEPRPDACPEAPFSDVPVDHPFCPEILWAENTDVANGYSDGTYRPSSDITRMAMAAFLARLAGYELSDCATAPFSDVPTDHTFCREIQALKANGITSGFSDGSFQPAAVITRQAMAAFLTRIAGARPGACTEPPFPDVPVDHPFCKEITWIAANDITTGFEDGNFRPAVPVTRQSMAAFVYRTWVVMTYGSRA